MVRADEIEHDRVVGEGRRHRAAGQHDVDWHENGRPVAGHQPCCDQEPGPVDSDGEVGRRFDGRGADRHDAGDRRDYVNDHGDFTHLDDFDDLVSHLEHDDGKEVDEEGELSRSTFSEGNLAHHTGRHAVCGALLFGFSFQNRKRLIRETVTNP